MSGLEITSIAASLLALLMLPLTLQITIKRAMLGKSLGDITAVVFGDGDDDTLRRRIRAFGNFIEYTPICLVMLGLLENGGAGNTLVWSVAGLLVGGRILHALGMLFAVSPAPRGVAMLMTYSAFLIPVGWLLSHV